LKRIIVTGGAGFIGSSLVKELIKSKNEVVVFDNFSRGNESNISRWIGRSNFKLVKADMLDKFSLSENVSRCDVVFHLAANPEVRLGAIDTKIDYEQNLLATYNLLEAMKNSTSCKTIVFASSSTVYGEPNTIPTSETYSPLIPISLYGASKLACEALIAGYCKMFDISGIALRLANVIGPETTHGVIYDFITKLIGIPANLDILGDGTQDKSYLFIDDCIHALAIAERLAAKNENYFDIFNVGSTNKISVLEIAKIVIKALSLQNVKVKIRGGIDGRGWKGDVKQMLLDCSKFKGLGWKARYNSTEAVYLTSHGIVNKLQNAMKTTTRCSCN
jgi:UDP-glucose 4-epimerase